MISHILKPTEVKRYIQAVIGWKQDLKELEQKHLFYSKYHNNFSIQEALFLTKEQMIETMFECVKNIELLEADLAFWEAKLYSHELAWREQKKSNKPFVGINLQEQTLTQQQLF